MKKIIYLLLTITQFYSHSYSQERDSLIQLYPGLGDTIALFDRNYFELFQNIDEFESAQFFIRNNEKLVSKVVCSQNGKQNDTTFIQQLSALEDVRERIKKIEEENESKYESPKEYLIKTKSGKQYLGKIEMFSKSKIYFRMQENNSNDLFNASNFKLDFSDVETIILVGETNTWSCMGWGALIAAGAGLVGALVSDSEYGIFGLPIVAALGALFGLVAGLITSTDDQVILIHYQNDLLQLKEYAKYYLGYDESVEKMYVEIE